MQDFSRELTNLTVPDDASLASQEFERAQAAKKNLADGYRALHRQDAPAALTLAEKAEALNPGFYQNATLRGRALLALGRRAEATSAFESALAAHPAFQKEKLELEQWLRQTKDAK